MCDKCNTRIRERRHKMAKHGHVGKNTGTDMADQVECSCGWQSRGYWDGAEWAWDEFDVHLTEVAHAKR